MVAVKFYRTTGFAISGIGGNFGGQLAPFAAYLVKITF